MTAVLVADLFDVLPAFPPSSFDAVVCDPPYGLEFMGKDWDRPWAVTAAQGVGYAGRDELTLPTHRDGRNANCRSCGGRARGANRCRCASPDWDRHPREDMLSFQAWVGGWAAQVMRVLKPGGHLLAFGGTRTFHRLASGIEDAGFEVRDCLAWMYGSGFPKSLDAAKAIDAARTDGWDRPWKDDPDAVERNSREYLPATDEAAEWRGWGTALKPAFEPVVLARRPLAGTVAENLLGYGVGAVNVDGCRIEWDGDGDEREAKDKNRHGDFDSAPRNDGSSGIYGADMRTGAEIGNYDAAGRWPANVLLDEEAAAQLDEQTSDLEATGVWPGARPSNAFGFGHVGQDGLDSRNARHERNGASRFFYTAKVSRAERNAGLDGFAAAPILWSSGEENPGSFQADGTDRSARNHHPTVKPVALMRWLVRLVTPPGGVVLDPFAGSGSTGIACALEGARFVGVERDPSYAAIAEARIAWWAEHGEDALAVVQERERSQQRRREIADAGQLDLLAGDAHA